MSQMTLGGDEPVAETPQVPRHKVEILATQLVAFTTPRYEAWAKAPVQLRNAALAAAEAALTACAEVYNELGGRSDG